MFVGEDDMNSWERITPGPGVLFTAKDEAYMLFRATLPEEDLRGKSLIFRNLWGKAEVYYGGKLAGKKTTDEPEEFGVKLPADAANETLTVLIKADPKGQAGIYGKVVL